MINSADEIDVFNKFKDEDGKFKESLIGDSPGLLALYEASHLMVHGEDILEDALAFTTTHLQSIANDPNNPLANQAIHALKRPIRKDMPMVEARYYIPSTKKKVHVIYHYSSLQSWTSTCCSHSIGKR